MIQRENERISRNIRFSGDDISLAAKMLDKISTTMDIIYYLMTRGEERAFVIILLSTKCKKTTEMLKNEKRDTDILFEIDGGNGIYAIICQDTKVDGGYRFAERIMKKLRENDAKDTYLTELEVRTTEYDIKYVIFKLIEMHIKSKIAKKEQEIVFNSLH
jgi:hypothetical protein